MTEIENLKASVALWLNAGDAKIEEFILSLEGANLKELDFTLLSGARFDLDRARKFLIIKDNQNV